MREIEIKLKVENLESVEKRLREMGGVIGDPITQEDLNFVHKEDINWFGPSHGEWLYPRLRKQAGKPLKLTVKKPISNEMDCIEHEIEVNDFEETKSIMKLFNYIEGVYVKKTRKTCRLGKYEITLDEVDGLGSFIEIEQVLEDGDPSVIQGEMFNFAKENFKLEKDENVMKGYDILMYHKLQGDN